MDKPGQEHVAHKLEEWAQAIPEVVRLLRQGQSDQFAYAMLYQLRWELGRLMVELPWAWGQPTKEYRDKAQEVLDSQRF